MNTKRDYDKLSENYMIFIPENGVLKKEIINLLNQVCIQKHGKSFDKE